MFALRKWYFDLTTADGSVFIGYRSHLRWGLLRVAHASYLVDRADGSTQDHGALRVGEEPHEDGDGLHWSCRSLRLAGTWRRHSSEVALQLLDEPAGMVHWRCLMPSAEATVTLDGETLRGTGYVEQLCMTVPPWRLPFHELRWGRALAAGRRLAWIDWRAGIERRWVIADGRQIALSRCDESGLTDGDSRILNLKQSRVLRDGTIGDALSGVPGLRWLVPRRLRQARETKWLSRADWPDGVSGWAIHEVVRWA